MNTAIKVLKKVLLFALIIFLLFFVGYQIYSAVYSPYRTETVAEVTHEDKLQVDGMFFRTEETVEAAHAGYIVHYLHSDGEKVGSGGVVAELYSSENDVLNYEKIKELEKRLSLLEESQDQSNALITNAEQITAQINAKLIELSSAVYKNDSALVNECKTELLVLFNRRNIITEKENDYSDYILQIKNEISSLKKKIKNSLKAISAQKNGNFVISTDGFEKSATPSAVLSMQTPEIQALIESGKPESVSENAIGKLVTDFEWYYAMILPIDQNEYDKKISEGDIIKMRFQDISDKIFSVTVAKIIPDVESGKLAVIVSSNCMTGEFCSARREKGDIIFSSQSGYEIKKSAVRIVDGQKGVYVIVGRQMVFRKINVIYETDEFFICESSNATGGLKPYDDVIVKGTDLYDGKSVQ